MAAGKYHTPVPKGAIYARVDQGVDYQTSSPYMAIGDGTVSKVAAHRFAGGTGDVVYITLDHPITVNGRTYTQVYYAEEKPLVRQGQRVSAGQQVMNGGGAELGFAANNSPVAQLVGGLGKGTQASQAGHDFYSFVHGAPTTTVDQSQPQQTTPDTTPDTSVADSQRDSLLAQDISGIQQVGGPPLATPPLHGATEDTNLLPQNQTASTWQMIATNGQVSQDTLRLAQQAQLGANATPSG